MRSYDRVYLNVLYVTVVFLSVWVAWVGPIIALGRGCFGLFLAQGVQDIQRDMMRYGSVTAAFSVYSDFLAYSGGVYRNLEGETRQNRASCRCFLLFWRRGCAFVPLFNKGKRASLSIQPPRELALMRLRFQEDLPP